MKDAKKIIDDYLKEVTLVTTGEEEGPLGIAWRKVASDIINTSIAAGKFNKRICIKRCGENEKCRQGCDLNAITLVLRSLQSGIIRCSGDRRCIKVISTRITNIAERGDEKVRQYGFGKPYLKGAMGFVSRYGFQAGGQLKR